MSEHLDTLEYRLYGQKQIRAKVKAVKTLLLEYVRGELDTCLDEAPDLDLIYNILDGLDDTLEADIDCLTEEFTEATLEEHQAKAKAKEQIKEAESITDCLLGGNDDA